MANYACKWCGYDEDNSASWCGLGCGRDYNEMILIPDSVVNQIKTLEGLLMSENGE